MSRCLASVVLVVALPIVFGCTFVGGRSGDQPPNPAVTPPNRLGEYVKQGIPEVYFEGVMRHCVATTFTAQMSVRGSAGPHRVSHRLWLAADRVAGSLRLESLESKLPLFTFAARDTFQRQADAHTFLSPQNNWVVRGAAPRAVLGSILGVPMSPDEFLWMLTGCSPNLSGHLLNGMRFGPGLMTISVEDLYPLNLELRRRNAASPWTLYAMSRRVPGRTLRWRMEVDERIGGIHRRFRIVSRQANGDDDPAFNLLVLLSHIQVNPRLGPDAFSPAVPASAKVVSLETVRPLDSPPLTSEKHRAH